MTPEGKVKAKVKRYLDRYPDHYREMPVPTGYGKSGLDFTVCFFGHFLAIETKVPGKKPTPRQEQTIKAITAAGGTVFVCDGTNYDELEQLLAALADYPNPSFAKAA
jgi:phosphoglycolate phosphatase-like HAD superfamily hydrolase